MKTIQSVRLLLLGGLLVATMGGCEFRCESEPKGPAEKIGESIDRAVDNVKDTEVKIKVEEKP